MLKVITKLDKENASLKETSRSYPDNLKTVKVFLKCFQRETKDLQETNQVIKPDNNTLFAEIRKFDNDNKIGNVSEMLNIKCRNLFKKDTCDDSY